MVAPCASHASPMNKVNLLLIVVGPGITICKVLG